MMVLEGLITHLRSVHVNRFVLISTIDVYADPSSQEDEDARLIQRSNHSYGKHRLWFEEKIKEMFQTHHIVRLPALFGRYMKKNYVYDLLHNREEFIQKINLDSKFQWYCMSHIWSDIVRIVENDLRVINLFTEPLEMRTVVQEVFPHHMRQYKLVACDSSPTIMYDLRTKYSNLWYGRAGYVQSATQVLDELKSFVASYRPQIHLNKLCISNIAWDMEENDVVLEFLKLKGITKIEVAPTKILASWDGCNTACAAEAIKSRLKDFQVVSLQSVLFNTVGLELFGSQSSRDDLLTHCKSVCELASNLGARVIVWGSPKQRLIHDKSYEECFHIAAKFFNSLGDYALEKDVVIGFEPNAKVYGCDFCFTAKQAVELVRAAKSPGFRLHLDTGNMHLEKDDIASILKENMDLLCHVQVSEPFLGGFDKPLVDHKILSENLRKFNYAGILSIEMRKGKDCLLSIAQAVAHVTTEYHDLLGCA